MCYFGVWNAMSIPYSQTIFINEYNEKRRMISESMGQIYMINHKFDYDFSLTYLLCNRFDILHCGHCSGSQKNIFVVSLVKDYS